MKKEDLEKTTVLPKGAIENMNAKEIVVYGSAIRFCFYEDKGNKKYHQSFEEWFFNLGFRKDRWQPVINSLIEKKYLTINKEIQDKKTGKSWNEYWITMPQEGRDEYDNVYTFNGQDKDIFKNTCKDYKNTNISFFGGYVVVPFDFLVSKNISDVKKQCLIWLKSEKEISDDVKNYKVHFKTIENITGIKHAKNYFNELKKEGLIDYTALNANNKNTSKVININIDFDAIINGSKKVNEVKVEEVKPVEINEEIFVEIDYEEMLKEMQVKEENIEENKPSLYNVNKWVENLQNNKIKESYYDEEEIPEDCELYDLMMAM